MKSKLLLDSHPLIVLPDLAVIVGLNEAIILQQVHYWTTINRKAKTNYRDGHTWTFNTYAKWQNQFPFWSIRTIRTTITRLETQKLLISNNYNSLKIDRTKWYRINYENLEYIIANSITVPCGKSCHMQVAESATPLPESKKQKPKIAKINNTDPNKTLVHTYAIDADPGQDIFTPALM